MGQSQLTNSPNFRPYRARAPTRLERDACCRRTGRPIAIPFPLVAGHAVARVWSKFHLSTATGRYKVSGPKTALISTTAPDYEEGFTSPTGRFTG